MNSVSEQFWHNLKIILLIRDTQEAMLFNMAGKKIETGHDETIVDGSLDFSGGVDSNLVTTVRSARVPNGLQRNQLAWMDNATCRNGGITQRTGQLYNGTISGLQGLYQGSFLYEPDDGSNPYFITVVGGVVWRIDPDNPSHPVNLSAQYHTGSDSMTMPATLSRVYFCQGEMILVIQAGDGVTKPLFWFGNLLRRSIGIVTKTPTQAPGQNELPPASSMDYYMGRIWYAQGRAFAAGDIVDGPSGTGTYALRDSIISVTENPLAIGGDGFAVPSNAGTIRAIKHTANINSQLGQGSLYVFTRKSIYQLQVPVSRSDWIATSNTSSATSQYPLLTVALISNGSVNDRSIVPVNGDLFYQSLDPAIRSFSVSVRNFQQWGNVPVSINETRILAFNDRALMQFGSGVYFDNRLIQTAAPYTSPVGVAHKALIPLNFDVISTFEQTLPPVWEGMYEGLNYLELASADFGGRQRAFSFVWSDLKSEYQLWELTDASRFDYAPAAPSNHRVTWYVEFPAFTWNREMDLKKLVTAELWVDKIFGDVQFKMEYRPDGDPCWYQWHEWKRCTAKTSCETVHEPVCYPLVPLRESFVQTMTLPEPKDVCESVSGRPARVAYQIQCKLTIIGYCRVRGLFLHALPVERTLFAAKVC